MSGFAVVYERAKTPVDPGVLVKVMQRLTHRGSDGKDTWQAGQVAMGHLHFWVTPEEQGEKQPLNLSGSLLTIVMDGRIDNRNEILHRLGEDENSDVVSDARLLLLAYTRWGRECFRDIIGEFAAVIWDDSSGEMTCVRDSVGDRTLFYTEQGTRVIIASEPWAVAAGFSHEVEINESAVAHHFALRPTEDGQTFFTGIFELLPAHWMVINDQKMVKNCYWEPVLLRTSRNKSDEDYIAEFTELLEESVRCRMRSCTPPGVMMSGGLDSTSVAAIAAKQLTPGRLKTISYVFNEFKDCDERAYIELMSQKLGLDSIHVPCDDCWPYKSWPEWPTDPSVPAANSYRLILEKTYAVCHQQGVRVVLTGLYGDTLYRRSEAWLADLLRYGKFRRFFDETRFLRKELGIQKIYQLGIPYKTLKDLALRIPGMEVLRKQPQPPVWLTDHASKLMESSKKAFKAETIDGFFNLRNSSSVAREIYFTNQHQMELRNPFRDRRMLDFFLNLPAYLCLSQGVTKKILREAMYSLLPEKVLNRKRHSNLLELYNHGVNQRKAEMIRSLDSGAAHKYVHKEFVTNMLQTEITLENDGGHTTIPTLYLFFDIWYKKALKWS